MNQNTFIDFHPTRKLMQFMKRKSKLFGMTVDSKYSEFDDLFADQ